MKDFDLLLEKAKSTMDLAGTAVGTAAVVVQMYDGTVFSDCQYALDGVNRFGELMDKIANHGDGKVDRMLCMWENGGFEVPHCELRKGIVACNPENENTVVYWPGKNLTLGEIRPPKK